MARLPRRRRRPRRPEPFGAGPTYGEFLEARGLPLVPRGAIELFRDLVSPEVYEAILAERERVGG